MWKTTEKGGLFKKNSTAVAKGKEKKGRVLKKGGGRRG
jgi:hypothetical protein